MEIKVVTPIKRRKASEIQAAIDELTREKERLQDQIREAQWENASDNDQVKSLLRYNSELATRIETLKWALGETF